MTQKICIPEQKDVPAFLINIIFFIRLYVTKGKITRRGNRRTKGKGILDVCIA